MFLGQDGVPIAKENTVAKVQAVQGKCVCGKTGLDAPAAATNLGACHCSMCRNWGGGPFLTVDCGTDVTLVGEEHIAVYDSSQWAERGFCKHCGTHLFYRLKESGQYIVAAGLFGDEPTFEFDHQVFIDEKPDYYAFENQTQNLTGAEVFEMFAPKD